MEPTVRRLGSAPVQISIPIDLHALLWQRSPADRAAVGDIQNHDRSQFDLPRRQRLRTPAAQLDIQGQHDILPGDRLSDIQGRTHLSSQVIQDPHLSAWNTAQSLFQYRLQTTATDSIGTVVGEGAQRLEDP